MGWLVESEVIEGEVDLLEVCCRPECFLLVPPEQREYPVDLGYMLALFGVATVQEAGDCQLVSTRQGRECRVRARQEDSEGGRMEGIEDG